MANIKVPMTLGVAANTTQSNWLDNTMQTLVEEMKRRCHKKSVSISYVKTNQYAAAVFIKDNDPRGPFTQEDWAFGRVIYPPPGGFEPGPGNTTIKFMKPWGELVFRTRTYNNPALFGQKLKGSGFATDAIAAVFNPARLEFLGKTLSQVVKHDIAASAVLHR
jgi:hypothetical protein